MNKKIVISIFCLILAGCATTPTAQQFAQADYGLPPTNYQEVVKNYYSETLLDPYSAQYRWLKEPYIGYFSAFGEFKFGYIVHVGVNAKNRMGGYVGEQQEALLIKNNRVIANIPLSMIKNQP